MNKYKVYEFINHFSVGKERLHTIRLLDSGAVHVVNDLELRKIYGSYCPEKWKK